MFKNAYQTGPSVPIFAPTGTKPCKQWTVAGNVSRSYDKASNGLAIECTGHSAKMSLPKRGGLDLRQRFLVVQLKLDPERQFTIGIGVESKDNVSTRRR
ncbi:hypothetical protein TrLO_g2179 [Triparma laevis f. longispina]|nr:hypothetical protein TrLO_g2179 [Triparma laevis f. longispina]